MTLTEIKTDIGGNNTNHKPVTDSASMCLCYTLGLICEFEYFDNMTEMQNCHCSYVYSSRATFLTWRRGVYEISVRRSIYWRPTDRRPATDDRPTTSHLENFKWPYLRDGTSSDSLHVWFYDGVFGVGGSNGDNSFLTKFNRYVGENNRRGVIRLVTI